MLRLVPLFALALALLPLSVGCQPDLREGYYSCALDSECPGGWFCVEARCQSTRGSDAAVDTAVDTQPDTSIDALADATPDGGCGGPDKVDLLVMIDDSVSMTQEQASLSEVFPELVRALSLGDTNGDGRPDTTPVTDLHVGVITSDMGTGGFLTPTCSEPDFGGDGILHTTSVTGGAACADSYPSFLTFDGAGLSSFREDFQCVASVGSGGCGFEQQLEAVLKAVTPSTSALRFHSSTTGHGDGVNAGFLREDSVLVVLVVTDEEDCSVVDPRLFDGSSGPFNTVDLNLRCTTDWGVQDPLHPISRYADGLRDLRPGHPERLIFAALVGVPVDVEVASFDDMLADDRMQYVISPEGSRLVASCDSLDRGLAFPPRRLVEAAQELQLTGSTGLVRSICQADYSGLVQGIIDEVAPLFAGECEGP